MRIIIRWLILKLQFQASGEAKAAKNLRAAGEVAFHSFVSNIHFSLPYLEYKEMIQVIKTSSALHLRYMQVMLTRQLHAFFPFESVDFFKWEVL